MADLRLSFSYVLHYAPQPSIMRGIAAFERSLKGALVREEGLTPLPMLFRDTQGQHRLSIGPDRFEFTAEPMTRIERFGPSATSLAAQFVRGTSSVAPREIELRASFSAPVPDPARSLGGFAICAFTWPRKLELRPEAMGKDHYMPTESGMVHLRLATMSSAAGHELRLLVSNRHDRIDAHEDVLSQAYALCLSGMQSIVRGIATPAYRRILEPVLLPQQRSGR